MMYQTKIPKKDKALMYEKMYHTIRKQCDDFAKKCKELEKKLKVKQIYIDELKKLIKGETNDKM